MLRLKNGVKAAIERKEVLGARDVQKKDVWRVTRKKREGLKGVYIGEKRR